MKLYKLFKCQNLMPENILLHYFRGIGIVRFQIKFQVLAFKCNEMVLISCNKIVFNHLFLNDLQNFATITFPTFVEELVLV